MKGLSISNLQVEPCFDISEYLAEYLQTPVLMLVSFHLVAVSVFLVEIASVYYNNYQTRKKEQKPFSVRFIEYRNI